MFVIFEGIDTTGKTTQIEKLRTRYPEMIVTKEPGGTALGVKLRSLLLEEDFKLSTNAELLLFLADRAEHYTKVVEPNKDNLVVSDRGFISGIAYALANHPEIDLPFLLRLNRFAMSGNLPDKIVLFITTKELLSQRMGNKSHDTIEQRGFDYLLCVQEWMQKVLSRLGVPYITIDASLDIETIHQHIQGFIHD